MCVCVPTSSFLSLSCSPPPADVKKREGRSSRGGGVTDGGALSIFKLAVLSQIPQSRPRARARRGSAARTQQIPRIPSFLFPLLLFSLFLRLVLRCLPGSSGGAVLRQQQQQAAATTPKLFLLNALGLEETRADHR